jgi:hypothetical protein
MVVVQGDADLLEVVLATQLVGGRSDLLDRTQEQAHQHRDDSDDNE